MEEKKKKVVNTTITRNTADFSNMTENIYETVAVLTKRANQIAAEEKRDLHNKIDDFTSRLKSCAATRCNPNPPSRPPKSTSKARSTTATPPKRAPK